MTDSSDAIDRVEAFHNPDRVNATQQSNPDRKRKFAKELEEELEKEKKRNRRRKDEVVLVSNSPATVQADNATQDQPESDDTADDDNEKENDGGRVDITA